MGLSLNKTWKAYKNVQKDNTRRFNNLTKDRQKQLRKKGYKNSGEANIKKSRALLNLYYPEVQKQEPECNYYVAVTNTDTNEVQYAGSEWYIGSKLWRKTDVSPLKSYESAAEIAEDVYMYSIQHNLPWKLNIQWEPK